MTSTDEINHSTVSGFTSLQLETLLASMHDLVFVLDTCRRFIRCFQSKYSTLQVPITNFTGKTIREVSFPAMTCDIIDNAITLASVTGKMQSVDFSLLSGEEQKWFNCNISTIHSYSDEDGGFLLIARDITDKARAIRSLEVHEKQLSLLTNNINDLVALYRPDGTLEYVSPSVKTLLGYDPEKLLGKDPSGIIHPDDEAAIKKNFLPESFPADKPYITEYRIIHTNGHWVHFETNRKFIRDEHGKVMNVVATCRDISAKKNAELALRESEERYRSLVESSAAIILLVDRDGNYLFSNKIAVDFIEKLYGDKEQRNNIKNFIFGEPLGLIMDTLRKVIDGNSGIELETALLNHENKLWFRISLQPVIDPSGKPYAVLVNAIDITENKQHRELLEKQNRELQEINFLQSHTVRAPLTNILALLNLMQTDELNEDNGTYIDLMKKAAVQLDDIIKKIVGKSSGHNEG